ncbi:M23 family metallopeptidase [Mesonia sp. HuA40]|uniref:M23 family metallopeptidase n=1 Tax=Mesonia sp. HuA40 TaxID=2602761 RepID=UPI0011CBDEC6|nr:M23 family metallopeptidase [Mesonia sp. HuA40]TXK72567.1 M23 family metallopeptidase [Mesonia sp. HuA40]
MSKPKKSKRIKKKLLYKYRLVVLNEDTFEEQFALRLNRLNIFVGVGISTILIIAFTTVLIAFTPLREYIPGYASTKLRKQATSLAYKTDSLQIALDQKNRYLESIRRVLAGEASPLDFEEETLDSVNQIVADTVNFNASETDSLLRKEVAEEERFNIQKQLDSKVEFSLFSPLKGEISESFNPQTKHYAVDVVAQENTPVKSIADGTVIFAEWSAATGYVIILEHNHGLLSVYKHNKSLTKAQGELVVAGEVIAKVGNTGELTTGPHLHFELWSNGYPVNPQEFIEF